MPRRPSRELEKPYARPHRYNTRSRSRSRTRDGDETGSRRNSGGSAPRKDRFGRDISQRTRAPSPLKPKQASSDRDTEIPIAPAPDKDGKMGEKTTVQQEDGLTEEERMMQQMLGFASFTSTKGQHVQDNEVIDHLASVPRKKDRKFRQFRRLKPYGESGGQSSSVNE